MSSSNQKIIGIVCRGYDKSIGITKAYARYFEMFGQIRLIWPGDDTIYSDLDLLVLPGGPDVDTKRYQEKPSSMQGRSEQFFEWFDTNHLDKYIKNGTKIFGICRGFQSINVHLGGDLIQDMIISHPTNMVSSGGSIKHQVQLQEEVSYKHTTFPKGSFVGVNSRHHQAVPLEGLADGLRILAVSKNDPNSKSFTQTIPEVVEAFISDNGQIVGVQWHPEDIPCVLSSLLIKNLLE